MSTLFKGQSLFEIKLDTGIDISTATEKKVLYKRPDGTLGEWVSTAVQSNPTGPPNTIMVYQLADGDINMAGNWQFQSYVVIGGKAGYGSIVTENVGVTLKV